MRSKARYHRWTKEDDVVTFYLYKFGDLGFPFSLEEIGERLGMGVSSLRMRIANFKAMDRKRGTCAFRATIAASLREIWENARRRTQV